MVLEEDSIFDILPLEIIEDTIDIIADDDRKSDPFSLPNLKACSLTCHAFLPRSTQHIFRTIKIHDSLPYIPRFPPESVALASSFAALLKSSPRITTLVRELHYIFPEIGGSLPDMAPILQTLSHLEAFCLYSDGGGTLQWWALTPRSRSIFQGLFHLPTITCLKLGAIIDFPPSLLLPCAQLHSVYLDMAVFDQDNMYNLSNTSASHTIKLQELGLNRERSMSLSMLSKMAKIVTQAGEPIFDLAGLRNFTTSIDDIDSVNFISKVLKRANGVESIRLLGATLSFDFNSPYSLVNLAAVKLSHAFGHDSHPLTIDRIICFLAPSLQTLKYLSLHMNAVPPRLLAEIPRALNVIAKEAVRVSRLTIQLSLKGDAISFAESVLEHKKTTAESEWDVLERALLSPGHWPRLKQVELEIFSSCGPTGSWVQDFSEFMRIWWGSISRREDVGTEFNFHAFGPIKTNLW